MTQPGPLDVERLERKVRPISFKSAPPNRAPRGRGPALPSPGPSGLLSNSAVVAIVVAVVVVFAVVVTLAVRGSASTQQAGSSVPAADAASAQVVRDSSHRLPEATEAKATFVEFLDFECEACRAAYPVVEQLRQHYAGRVTFVVRYFPIESHFNASAPRARSRRPRSRASSRRCTRRCTPPRTQWGEQQVAADDAFRGFAVDLGLDMARWDAAYNAPATIDRINLDIADGKALGVESTPSFFVNGQRIQPKSVDDLSGALDAALAE